MPNLRSVIAQVHQKSRSIGSHRSFSTSSSPPTETYEEGLARVRPYSWMISRSVGAVIGFVSARYYFGDLVARYEAWLIEGLREEHKLYGKFRSDIGKS